MTGRFIDGLHDDLVGAIERYEHRPRWRLWLRLPRPERFLRPLSVAAATVAIVAGSRGLDHHAPVRRPDVSVLSIGGEPVDAALSDGSLWVSDFKGSLVQVDPRAQRVTRRIPLPEAPEAVAADAGSVWVLGTGTQPCGGDLLRIDAHSGTVADRRRLPYPPNRAPDGGLAADGDRLWIRSCADGEGAARLDRAGNVTAGASLPGIDGVVVAPQSVWAISHDGTLVEMDRASGRVRHRWRNLAPLGDPTFTYATNVIAADATGAWVLSTGRAAMLRVQDGRVVRQIPVDARARPLLAGARDRLWVAATDRSGRRHRLLSYDRATGRLIGRLELGVRRPVTLVPAGDRLCVITGDGRVLFVTM